jgi:hypothetical protein
MSSSLYVWLIIRQTRDIKSCSSLFFEYWS